MLEAFFHARFFLEMAVRYANLPEPLSPLPSGYAALPYLHGLRRSSAHQETAHEWYTDATPTMAPKSTGLPPDTAGLDGTARSHRQWLDNWKRVGPILEKERWDRVKALTDADAARDALWLFELWQRDWPTDDGEELLRHQRVFARARRP
jgi:hypothetical protein